MAFDEGLGQRVREALIEQEGLAEKKMFGGLAFMVHGNMACGVIDEDLIVRVGKENYEEALGEAETRPFDMTGRPMTGWVVVEGAALADRRRLLSWVDMGVATALGLPAK